MTMWLLGAAWAAPMTCDEVKLAALSRDAASVVGEVYERGVCDGALICVSSGDVPDRIRDAVRQSLRPCEAAEAAPTEAPALPSTATTALACIETRREVERKIRTRQAVGWGVGTPLAALGALWATATVTAAVRQDPEWTTALPMTALFGGGAAAAFGLTLPTVPALREDLAAIRCE